MRIQILPLPAVMVGDDLQEPFALVIDQAPIPVIVDEVTAEASRVQFEAWDHFREQCGARAHMVTPETVEIVDGYAETPTQEAAPQTFVGHFGEHEKLTDKLCTVGDALLTPNPIVVLDGNGDAMNMQVTCSCGSAMTLDLPTSWREKTEILCKGCGNRLTVTVPLGGQA